jgi:UDPglucose 6-dehydrogenase
MMADITMLGCGYVGLVTGACLSDFGNTVICVDTDQKKIDALRSGTIPLYENSLAELVARNRTAERLSFTDNAVEAIQDADIVFIAVGTPPAEDGSADLRYVEAAARQIGKLMNSYKVIVNKSTVPVGTARHVRSWVQEELDARESELSFDVVSNPEFLREGSAVYDFMHPDRVVIGSESDKASELMKGIYRTLYLNETPFVFTSPESAEMIKYASNSFLAMKITFINEIANLCDAIGANVQDVATAIGKDGRIGAKFLHPGPGYGGSCFPKDTRALASIAAAAGSPLSLIETVIQANERQKLRVVEKIAAAMQPLEGKTIAVLGLAFKQNTNDMRESPALSVIMELVRRGARVKAFDPAAMTEAQWRLESVDGQVTYCLSEYDALKEADAMVILTEWNQFRNLDLGKAKKLLRGQHLFDFRNLYERKNVEDHGFQYTCLGR